MLFQAVVNQNVAFGFQKKPPYSSNPITPTILLNKPVSSIKWQLEDEDGKPYVEVVCADGAKYETKAVISTVTVGVLKER